MNSYLNILFDQTEAQAPFWNGAAEYAQSVFLKLLSKTQHDSHVKLFCLYSSAKAFRYELLSPQKVKGATYLDYKDTDLKTIIKENHIDILFVTCAQSFCDLPLGNVEHLGCKVVAVIHDLLDEEMDNSKIQLFKYLMQPWKFLRYVLGKTKIRLVTGNMRGRKKTMQRMLTTNNSTIVTVSEYTKSAIKYHYPSWENDIRVYAAPEKRAGNTDRIDNAELAQLVSSGKKYFLLLSADRVLKNAKSMMNAFHVFCKVSKADVLLVTVGIENKAFNNHLPLPFLSPSDLEHAYRNCYALLYPSLFEGFGYPPIEAMKYSKPVLSSNICSMPEVLGCAPIYFSPLYESDMFRALMEFWEEDYDILCKQARLHYDVVAKRQASDLDRLINDLTEKNFFQ